MSDEQKRERFEALYNRKNSLTTKERAELHILTLDLKQSLFKNKEYGVVESDNQSISRKYKKVFKYG